MFEALGSFFKNNFNKQSKVLMIGPFHTGRSTILYKLKIGQNIQPMPTMGFNVQSIQHKVSVKRTLKIPKRNKTAPGQQKQPQYIQKQYTKNTKIKMNIWDIGGAGKLRALFPHYYPDTDVLIYVIDTEMVFDNDYKMHIAEEDINNFLNHPSLPQTASILFLINKVDLFTEGKLQQTVKSEQPITKQLMVQKLQVVIDKHKNKLKQHQYAIKFCSAITDEGLDEMLDWVSAQCAKK